VVMSGHLTTDGKASRDGGIMNEIRLSRSRAWLYVAAGWAVLIVLGVVL
jgi:hypothetical protein